jgi:hypothetical protein
MVFRSARAWAVSPAAAEVTAPAAALSCSARACSAIRANTRTSRRRCSGLEFNTASIIVRTSSGGGRILPLWRRKIVLEQLIPQSAEQGGDDALVGNCQNRACAIRTRSLAEGDIEGHCPPPK